MVNESVGGGNVFQLTAMDGNTRSSTNQRSRLLRRCRRACRTVRPRAPLFSISHQHHSQSSTPLGKFARSIDHIHLAVISTTATPARCFNLTHAMGIVACFLSLSMFRHFRESLLQYPLLLASLGTGGGEHQRRPNGANQKTRQDHRSYSIPLLECFPRPCR